LVFEPGSKFPTPYSTGELFSKGRYPEVLRHQPMIVRVQPLIEFLNQTLVGKQFYLNNLALLLCIPAGFADPSKRTP
jgi:hypothetical protein